MSVLSTYGKIVTRQYYYDVLLFPVDRKRWAKDIVSLIFGIDEEEEEQ
jgi:hypothetical protein